VNELRNEFGQPVGQPIQGWTPRPRPPDTPMAGARCTLERLAERHATQLYAAYAEAPDARDWTYVPNGPFPDLDSYRAFVRAASESRDPLHYAIIDARSGTPVGTAALLRIDAANGVLEVGAVYYSPRLQRTPAGTEAMYLLMRRVFDELGYRRYEWKCDALNDRSRRAAERYGFTFEGVFRQLMVRKGRNRDTAWFSILDTEWPRVRAGFEAWLAPENFDAAGRQRRALAEIRRTM
jgi:RimJ/RimL family protein N-acetyltransferase